MDPLGELGVHHAVCPPPPKTWWEGCSTLKRNVFKNFEDRLKTEQMACKYSSGKKNVEAIEGPQRGRGRFTTVNHRGQREAKAVENES